MILSVRDVDPSTFREFKAEAVKQKVNIGKALTLAMKAWLDTSLPKKSFLELKPIDWGEGTKTVSKDIDKVLYS